MEDYFEIIRQVLVPMFFKEAQIGRSLGEDNPERARIDQYCRIVAS